jgi:hypothetical protein
MNLRTIALGKGKGGGGASKVNLAIKVEGFVEDGEKGMGILGTRLDTGEEVKAFLTTKGYSAENKRRKSVAELGKGVKFGRNVYKLEPGGVICLKGAFELNDNKGEHIGHWIDVLGYNAEDYKNYVGHGVATLEMGRAKDGKVFGTLYHYLGEKLHVTGDSPQAVRPNIEHLAKGIARPSFLVRYLDKEGKVVLNSRINPTWNKSENRELTPAEKAEAVVRECEKWGLTHQAISSVNIVPAQRFVVSPKTLIGDENKNNGKAEAYQKLSERFLKEQDNGELELVAHECYYKMGGDQNIFVNNVIMTDPSGDGVDPALIGGLEYSEHFSEALEMALAGGQAASVPAEAEAPAEQEAETAAAVAGAEEQNEESASVPEGFEELDGMDFGDEDDQSCGMRP